MSFEPRRELVPDLNAQWRHFYDDSPMAPLGPWPQATRHWLMHPSDTEPRRYRLRSYYVDTMSLFWERI